MNRPRILIIMFLILFWNSRFDFTKNEWTEIASMSTPCRGNAGLVVLLGRIFRIGGLGFENRRHNNVDYYDPLTDKWQAVAPMHYERGAPAACALNGLIYVLGGESSGPTLRSIERYDPRADSWTEVNYNLLNIST